MKIRLTAVLDVDPATWYREYGVGHGLTGRAREAAIREAVLSSALNAIQYAITIPDDDNTAELVK